MKLSELRIGQKVIVQVTWGEQKIEFGADVLEVESRGVYVTSYIYQNAPLELTIDAGSNVVCNLYTDAPGTKQRISWKNVELHTVVINQKKVYFITANMYNYIAQSDDRRKHDRLVIRKNAKVYDPGTKKYSDIKIHDISDTGISFYAPANYQPDSDQVTVVFEDSVNEKDFCVRVDCRPVRIRKNPGLDFWGCKIIGENKEFLQYSFLLRLTNKKE